MRPAPPDDQGPIDACPACGERSYGCLLCSGSGIVSTGVAVEYGLRKEEFAEMGDLERRQAVHSLRRQWGDYSE